MRRGHGRTRAVGAARRARAPEPEPDQEAEQATASRSSDSIAGRSRRRDTVDAMIKTPKLPKTLVLHRETVVHLGNDQLKHVIGGVNSTRPSQCVTLCF